MDIMKTGLLSIKGLAIIAVAAVYIFLQGCTEPRIAFTLNI